MGNQEVAALVKNAGLGEKVGFLDENEILPFDAVHEVVKEALAGILNGQELPRGITGWYYQQFLKMQYSRNCEDAYYLVRMGIPYPAVPFPCFMKGRGSPIWI